MFKAMHRAFVAAALLPAAIGPSVASARFLDDPVPQPAATATPSPARAVPAEPGFQWGDAGVGAGGALVLIALASGGVAVHRRRTGPLTS